MPISCKDFLTPKDFNLIIKTSEVTIYDGGPFSCVSLPASPNLNDVLEALEAKVCDIQNVQLIALKTSFTTDYDGTQTASCFTLTPNAGLNTTIDELSDQICVNTTALTDLNCTGVDVGGVFSPVNYTAISANLCGHIEGIDNALGTFLTSIPACLGTNLFTDGNNGTMETGVTGMASVDFTTLAQDATEFYSGTKSLKGTKGASSTTEKIEGSTTISFVAGESYTLIAYVRIPSGNSTGGNVSIHGYSGATIFAEQTEIDQFNGATASNQDKWILVQTQLQSSTNQTLTVGVRAQGLSSSDVVFIDQVEVRCGSQTLVTQQQLIDRFRQFICPWTVSGGNITTSPTLLTVDIDESLYEVDGAFVFVPDTTATTSITVIATSDNYLDIDQVGNYIVTAVAISSSEPALASGRMRLFLLTTDGSGVTATVDRQNPFPLDGIFLKDDAILTRHILDANVTGAKLEDFGPGASTVQAANVTVDAKGRISTMSTEFLIAGPVSGETLLHDGSDFVNVPIVGNILPSASDDDTMRFDIGSGNWESSSFLRNTGTALGVSLSTPQVAFNMNSSLEFAINMAIPGGVGSVLVAGGSLAIDTFFYVVTALDDGTGETIASSETSQTTDAGNKTIDISWSAVTGASSYRVYQGTATGVYTQFFTVTAPTVTYSDDGTAGAAGTPPSVTTAYVVLLGSSHFLDDVGIGTTAPDASSILDVKSITAGFLMPRVTTTQRDAISAPVESLFVWNTTTKRFNFFETTWKEIGFIENTQVDNRITRGDGTDSIQSSNWEIDDTATGTLFSTAAGTDIGKLAAANRVRSIFLDTSIDFSTTLAINKAGVAAFIFSTDGTDDTITAQGTNLVLDANNAAGNILFKANGSEVARFETDGDFVIGATTAGARLHVKGDGVSTLNFLIEDNTGADILQVNNSLASFGFNTPAQTINGKKYAFSNADFRDGIEMSMTSTNVNVGSALLVSNLGTAASQNIGVKINCSGASTNIALDIATGSLFFPLANTDTISIGHSSVQTSALVNIRTKAANGAFQIKESVSNVASFIVTDDKNVGIIATSFGTNAVGVLGIKNGTPPITAPADTIQIHSKDATADAALATLALHLEQSPVVIGTFTPSHKLAIWVNGVEYHISLDAV